MLEKYFPKVEKPISYEGRDSKNPLTFTFYNKEQKNSNVIITSTINLNQNSLGSPQINFNESVKSSFHNPLNHYYVHVSRMDIFAYQFENVGYSFL